MPDPEIDLALQVPRAADPLDNIVVVKEDSPEEMGLVPLTNVLDRANHIGTQGAATISDFAEAVDDRVAALIVAGTNVTVTYNDSLGTLTFDVAGGGAGTDLSYTAASRLLASSTGADVTLPLVGADAGLMTAADKTKLDGIASGAQVNVPTDLSYTAASRLLASSTGADVTLPLVGADAGLMAAADKTKLDGVATGATANSSDATLLNRANHTGTQLASTISNFAATVIATVLTGFAAAGTRTAIVATDSILTAFGKVQKYLNDLAAVAFSGSASDLSAGTLPAARFDDTAHGARAGGTLHASVVAAGAAGFMTGADKTKLDGVATGATANSADATLLARANHTGTQTAATISDFNSAARAQVEAELIAGTNVTITPAGSGATRTLTIAATGGGGGGSPGGSNGEVQYNNAGAFAGAPDVEIEGGQLRLPAIAKPASPAAGGIKLYTRSQVGQRNTLSILYPNGREARIDEDEGEFLQLQYRPAPNSNALLGDGSLPQTITGTATASTVQVTNFYTMFPKIEARVATAAATAIAGFRGAIGVVRVGSDANAPGGFNFRCAWGPGGFSMPATHRACCGLLNSTAAPTDVEPSTLINGVWMGWDAGDTNVQVMHNDASGTATKIDLGASFAVPTGTDFNTVYLLELFSPNEATQSVQYHVVKFNTATRTILAEANGTITTKLPAVTLTLANRVWCSVGGTSSAVGVTLFGVCIDLDYS